jgi:hypothetical protein
MKRNRTISDLPVVQMQVNLHAWRCSCGARMAGWYSECAHCNKRRPKRTVSGPQVGG